MSTLSQPVVLHTQEKIQLLSEAIRSGGEKSLRFVAQVIGAGACPKCDYVITHCKCSKDD